jgi:RNA polymerase sigma-70 factor (ECF subfamily)
MTDKSRRYHRLSASVRTNQDWLDCLDTSHPGFNSAMSDLGDYLMKGLRQTFIGHSKLTHENLEDFCQEALMKILSKYDSYSGKSRFTTWAMKVAVNLVLSEIRKKAWKDVILEPFDASESFLDINRGNGLFSSIEHKVIRKEMAEICNRLIELLLTDRQRTALIYRMKYGMPLDEIARRNGTTRNSVYKLLHDARKKLKQGMEQRGITNKDIAEIEQYVP